MSIKSYMSKLKIRLQPLFDKLLGLAPLCPWSALASLIDPRTLRVFPPAQLIKAVEVESQRTLLEFAGRHRFWFPEKMPISPELWSEYLVAFWDNPKNHHQYLRGGVDIQPGDIVLDCGACEGFFTRKALEAGAAKVICIEPAAKMVECLQLTFAKEIEEGNVVVLPVALGSFSGSADFASSDDDAFSGHFEGKGGETVEVKTLEEIAREYGMPTFIKMDLEGSEYQALVGGVDYLKSSHPKLGITTYHNIWDYAVVSALLKGLGYRRVQPYGVSLRGGNTPRPVMLHAWQP